MSDPIIRIAARGDGVSASGKFVSGAVPGDELEADGTITPGPHRQPPACKHFGRCGGCQLQHIDDAVYADFIHDRIAEALRAQGLTEPDIRKPHLSPPHSRRRVSLRAMRQGKQVTLGYAAAASHALIDIKDCPVMHPELLALLAPLRHFIGPLMQGRRPADIRMTLADQGVDMMIAGIEIDGLAATEAVSAFALKHRLARLSVDEGYGPAPRWEPEAVTITLAGVATPLPEGAFLQATADGEAALVEAVRSIVKDASQTTDLFAGLGTFSFAVSGHVHAVEGARDALLALQAAANRTSRLVSAEHRDLFRRPLTAKDLQRFDAIILDPPRAGAKEQVLEIATSNVPRLAYVSCNPSTFARDAKALVDGGYVLEWIQPVGQFRWSTHVELAACFSKPR